MAVTGETSLRTSYLRPSKGGRKKQTLYVEDDQFGSPTWTFRLAYQIREMLREDVHGTYHATSEGFCSRLEFAKAVLDKLNVRANLEPLKTADVAPAAMRPLNGILENRLP